MNLRLRFLLPIGALLLLLSTFAGACGDDDELTLEEFFQQGKAIFDDFDERSEALFTLPAEDREFFSNEENLLVWRDLFARRLVFLKEFSDELERLNPPREAEDARDEMVASAREVVQLQEAFADRLQAAESFSEFNQIRDELNAEGGGAFNRFFAACVSLQRIADANDIVTDLQCEV